MTHRMKSVIMLVGLLSLVLVSLAGAQSFTFAPNPIPTGAVGFNPVVNYTLPNWSQSPISGSSSISCRAWVLPGAHLVR